MGRFAPTSKSEHSGISVGDGPRPARGRTLCAPTAKTTPWTLVRKRQVQNWNRTDYNFCSPRAKWPELNGGTPLRFCAPEIFCPAQGVTTVNGGLGADSPCQGEMARRARGGRESRHGERSSPLRRPPASFGSFSTRKRNSPRRAKPYKTRRRGRATALRGSSNDVCSLSCPLSAPGERL